MNRTRNVFIVLFSLILNSLTASAAPVFTNKKWNLEITDKLCIANTVANVDNEAQNLFSFEMAFPKTGQGALEFYIRPLTPSTTKIFFKVPTDENRKTIYNFARLQTDDSSEVYWNIPRGTDNLSFSIRTNDELLAILNEAGKQDRLIRFSLSGSSAVYNRLLKDCFGGKEIEQAAFEKIFLPSIVTKLDASKLSPEQTLKLRALFLFGFESQRQLGLLNPELTALRDRFKKDLNELKDINATIERVTKREMEPLVTRKAKVVANIAKAQSEIARLQQLIPETQGKLAVAQSEFDQSALIINPLLPEYRRLNGKVDASESEISQIEGRIRTIDSVVAKNEAEIRDLTSELQSLRSQVSRLQSDLRSAETDFSRAQSEFLGFNEQSETQEELRRNFSYQNSKRELERIESEIRRFESDSFRAQSDRDRARSELQQCQAMTGADCSRQMNEASRTSQAYDQIQSQLSSLRSNKNSKEDEIRRIELQASDSVRSKKQELRAKMDRAQDRVNEIQSNLRTAESKMRDIQSEIPRLQSENSSLRSERPRLTSRLSEARQELSRNESELAAWKASVDFDRKWTDYQSKLSRLNSLKEALADQKDDLASNQSDLSKNQTELAQLELKIARVQATLDTWNGKKAVVEQRLSVFRSEETRIQNLISENQKNLQASKTEFEALVR